MSKKTPKSTVIEQVASPLVETADSAPVVAAEKKTRKPKAVSASSSTATASSATVAAASTTSTVTATATLASVIETAAVNEVVETPVAEQSVEFLAKLQQLGVIISSLKAEYRTLEKKWTREIKAAQKLSSKRKRKAGNRAPSGFVKPTKISDELASFLGKEKGTEMARTDVTREINTYIRAHKLQDKDNGRKIIPDSKLATLLKLKKTDELTYFNLQKYMSPHFAKSVKAEAAAAAAAASVV